MLMGPWEAQHWVQLADCRDPNASLGALFNDLALALEEVKHIIEQLWDSICWVFPNPIDYPQIQECKKIQ